MVREPDEGSRCWMEKELQAADGELEHRQKGAEQEQAGRSRYRQSSATDRQHGTKEQAEEGSNKPRSGTGSNQRRVRGKPGRQEIWNTGTLEQVLGS